MIKTELNFPPKIREKIKNNFDIILLILYLVMKKLYQQLVERKIIDYILICNIQFWG